MGISCELGFLNMAAPLSVEVEFGGGAELLFDGVKKHQVTLPGQEEPWVIRDLLVWIKKNLLKERPELFIQGDSVTGCSRACGCLRPRAASLIPRSQESLCSRTGLWEAPESEAARNSGAD
ncbi:ubiquitin-related modifier 1 isoform X1 [Mustela nigripes]|uniref:Ubiquitin-related modifier 1 n=1 Tax=Mustela putorius furo TaxID=9669 RepID=A0A8U0NVH5_MUSPF|nr:ubiquitin-related modifier 1 isoform X2 [Mustela putorius furo]XP_058997486.1 ubiquitin-related modifier 1 isoform X1 [Mustela lutreola]XP_059266641.1 ubiquitin-related modifier 1 isoform X1 [Mustela nigripes]